MGACSQAYANLEKELADLVALFEDTQKMFEEQDGQEYKVGSIEFANSATRNIPITCNV
jgi:hypothetical protein